MKRKAQQNNGGYDRVCVIQWKDLTTGKLETHQKAHRSHISVIIMALPFTGSLKVLKRNINELWYTNSNIKELAHVHATCFMYQSWMYTINLGWYWYCLWPYSWRYTDICGKIHPLTFLREICTRISLSGYTLPCSWISLKFTIM